MEISLACMHMQLTLQAPITMSSIKKQLSCQAVFKPEESTFAEDYWNRAAESHWCYWDHLELVKNQRRCQVPNMRVSNHLAWVACPTVIWIRDKRQEGVGVSESTIDLMEKKLLGTWWLTIVWTLTCMVLPLYVIWFFDKPCTLTTSHHTILRQKCTCFSMHSTLLVPGWWFSSLIYLTLIHHDYYIGSILPTVVYWGMR